MSFTSFLRISRNIAFGTVSNDPTQSIQCNDVSVLQSDLALVAR